MEAIRLSGYSFYYPNEEKPAIDNIDFAVSFGELVTLCGKSGSGKTTLLKCLKPELAPYGKRIGKIFIEGEEVSDISEVDGSRIGFVMQNPDNQIVTDTVWQELSFGLENMGMSREEMRIRVSELATFFGMEKWFHKNTSDLSGGQKQILNLASVMVMEPEILILDEPTSQLDPIAAGEFMSTLARINRELGTTVILSEHRLEEAFAYTDRVVVMEDGRIIADDVPDKIGKAIKENDMFLSLPASVRIFESMEGDGNCPVTVQGARTWLKKYTENCPVASVYLGGKPREVSKENAVVLKNLYYKYGKNQTYVLSGLSLEVKNGECLGILGGNGSGKSTLLWLIAGGLKLQSGKVKTNGKTFMVSQNPECMFTKATVFDEILDVADEVEAESMLSLYGLSQLKDRHPYDLSGGEQQKLALCKVLLKKPDILLMDEPSKGLDAHFKMELSKMLCDLMDKGVTVIMVSHDVEFCAGVCTRCGLLFDGQITSSGEPQEFFGGKKFYTTQTARIFKGFSDKVILAEKGVELLKFLEGSK